MQLIDRKRQKPPWDLWDRQTQNEQIRIERPIGISMHIYVPIVPYIPLYLSIYLNRKRKRDGVAGTFGGTFDGTVVSWQSHWVLA